MAMVKALTSSCPLAVRCECLCDGNLILLFSAGPPVVVNYHDIGKWAGEANGVPGAGKS